MSASPSDLAAPRNRRRALVAAALLCALAALGFAAWRRRSAARPRAARAAAPSPGDNRRVSRAGATPVVNHDPPPGAASDARASVTCRTVTRGGDPAIECEVALRQGDGAREACWDTAVECQGGVRASAHRCQSVRPGAPETVLLPRSAFAGGERCSGADRIVVDRLTVAGP